MMAESVQKRDALYAWFRDSRETLKRKSTWSTSAQTTAHVEARDGAENSRLYLPSNAQDGNLLQIGLKYGNGMLINIWHFDMLTSACKLSLVGACPSNDG